MNALPKLFPLLLCLAALSGGAAVSTNSLIIAPPPMQIVTCREEADLDALIGGDGIGHDYTYQTGTSVAAPHVTGLVALYIAANGRAHDEKGVYKIRQAIIDASLPQSQWNTNNTHDPDTNPEPLAVATETWVPPPFITDAAGAPGKFQVSFAAVPGYYYTVQSAGALTPPISWTNLLTVSGTNFVAPVSVTDTNAASQSFYQLLRRPSPFDTVYSCQPICRLTTSPAS